MEAKQSVMSDGSHRREIRTRQRHSMSCTECRRRKQKCNQAKNTACNNCARRSPPVPCIYDSFRTLSKYKECIIDLSVIETKLEDSESEELEILSPVYEIDSPVQQISQHILPQSQRPDTSISFSSQAGLAGFHELPFKSVILDSATIRNENTSGHDFGIITRRSIQDPQHQECDNSYGFELNVVGGGVAMDPLRFLPIEPTGRNAHLFHFFVQRLSPFISSIDGCSPSDYFTSQWLSFMTQSPIAIHVAILSAAYFQASTRRLDVEKSVDAMSSKCRLIALINNHISGQVGGVSDESIAAVMSLASNEAIYSDQISTMAHMQGLRDMVDTRGGLDNIQFGLLRRMLWRTDYQIASTYECEVILNTTCQHQPIPVLSSLPRELDNPILRSHIPFVDTTAVQNINIETAQLLDDTRFLTVSVLTLAEDNLTPYSQDKLLAGIHWNHQRLASSSVTNSSYPQDMLYQTCRTAAIIYSSAIVTQTPLSIVCTPQLLQKLWITMWQVPLQRWKQIPGIFLWIMLVASPFARDKPEGRFFKSLIPVTIMAMSLKDEETVLITLKGFIAVQRWLRSTSGETVLSLGDTAASRTPQNELPAWTMSEDSLNIISMV